MKARSLGSRNMTKQQFDTFVETKAREPKESDSIDWEARKLEWLDALARFYREVELWLKDYVAADKIQMKSGELLLHEEYIGTYPAQTRVIIIGADRVVLKPIGTLLIGTRGRVDMEGPKGSVKFILTGKHSNGIDISLSVVDRKGVRARKEKAQPEAPEEWVWKIATPPPKIRFIELNAEAFFDALMEVVNG